jgi:hypothetical protein
MTNLQKQPNNIPLILILIGTTFLAFPAALGTFALFDTSGSGIHVSETPGLALFGISIAGFLLYAGYILTSLCRRHSSLFWFFSMLYNLALSGVYWYLIFLEFLANPKGLVMNATESTVLLVPLWTSFVTIASGYYCLFPLFRQKTEYF